MIATRLQNAEPRPCLLLAHTDPVYRAVTSRYLTQLGWDVCLAADGPEARRLRPTVVALQTALPMESGWLTCHKLLAERPEQKVLLVTRRLTPEKLRLSAFVGAAGLVDRNHGVAGLVEAVFGAALRAVG